MSDLANWTTLKAQTDRNEFVATDMKVVATFLAIAAREHADGHRSEIDAQFRYIQVEVQSLQQKLIAYDPGEI